MVVVLWHWTFSTGTPWRDSRSGGATTRSIAVLAFALLLFYADQIAQQAAQAGVAAMSAVHDVSEWYVEVTQSPEYVLVDDLLDLGVTAGGVGGIAKWLLARRGGATKDDNDP